MAQHFPNLMKDRTTQIQKDVQQIPTWKTSERTHLTHIIVKLSRAKDKIIKEERRKQFVIEVIFNKILDDFSPGTVN